MTRHNPELGTFAYTKSVTLTPVHRDRNPRFRLN